MCNCSEGLIKRKVHGLLLICHQKMVDTSKLQVDSAVLATQTDGECGKTFVIVDSIIRSTVSLVSGIMYTMTYRNVNCLRT